MNVLVLGMDGGQTSTTAAVCESDGRLRGVGRAGPANHVWEPGGVARARRAVRKSAREALRRAGIGDTRLQAAFLGITGTKGDGRTARALQDCLPVDCLRIANDKVNALASVTAGKPGVVVIAGTGTIAYGENARGRGETASGWGYLLGDEGAGFWIARESIAAACRAYDGRGEKTHLADLLLKAASVRELWDLHFLIYSEKLSRADMAGLAAVVPEAARAGDRAARRILRAAGRELGLAGGTVARRLGLHGGACTVGMVGGVFRSSGEVRETFREETRKHIPEAVLVGPRYSPVIGSVLLALKLAGVRLTKRVLANLDAASQQVGAK
jgi:N-acetylglucosamine kinase-like BadF-type ATPase